MRIARVIGIALVALSGASLSGCVIGLGVNGGGGLPSLGGRGGGRTVVEGGHSHLICRGGQLWIQNYGLAGESPDGDPFLAEEQVPCGADRLMHPLLPEHQTGHAAWVAARKR